MAAVFNGLVSTTQARVTDFVFNSTKNPESSPCVVLKFKGVPPWNNPENVVSAYAEDLVHRVKYAVILPILFLIGGTGNVINMAVFYKQGLNERMNVCLFALSVSDFLRLFCNFVFYSQQMYLQLANDFSIEEKYGPVMRFIINNNLLGFFGFTRSSQIIFSFIACERCFCILRPLRSQTALSTLTTTVITVTISVLMVGLYSITVTRYRAVCVHDPLSDSDSWNLVPSQFYFQHRTLIDSLDVYLFGVVIPFSVMGVVTTTTAVIVVKLRQAAAWRVSASSSGSVSAKEMALTVMLVYNSIFFIVCVSPLALFRLAWLVIPGLQAGKSQHNLYFLCNWLLDTVGYIHASFNFLIYYTMGSRYRQTLWQLMGRDSKPVG